MYRQQPQLKGSHSDHDEMGQEGVPSLVYLEGKMPEGRSLGFDSQVICLQLKGACWRMLRGRGAYFLAPMPGRHVSWQEQRPEPSAEPWVLDERYAGKRAHWIAMDVRGPLSAGKGTCIVRALLDDTRVAVKYQSQ